MVKPAQINLLLEIAQTPHTSMEALVRLVQLANTALMERLLLAQQVSSALEVFPGVKLVLLVMIAQMLQLLLSVGLVHILMEAIAFNVHKVNSVPLMAKQELVLKVIILRPDGVDVKFVQQEVCVQVE